MREVRGATVLSMWLGNYDLRWDNNKVKLVEFAKDKQRLALYLRHRRGPRRRDQHHVAQ